MNFYASKSEQYARTKIEKIVDKSLNLCAIFETVYDCAKKRIAEGDIPEQYVFSATLSDDQIASLIKAGDPDKAFKLTSAIFTWRVKFNAEYTFKSGRVVSIPKTFEFFSTDEYLDVHGDAELSSADRFSKLLEMQKQEKENFETAKAAAAAVLDELATAESNK